MVLDTYSTVWMVREAVALVPLDRHTEGVKKRKYLRIYFAGLKGKKIWQPCCYWQPQSLIRESIEEVGRKQSRDGVRKQRKK